MDNTYIKLFRKMLTWEWYTDANTVRVFLHILLKANYKPTRYKGHEIPIGSCVFGRKAWAEELRMTEQQVRTAIDHLKNSGEITIKTTNKFSVITLENWGKWQLLEGVSNQQANQQVTNNQPTTNQQLTTSKESKKVRIKESKKYIYKDLPSDLAEALHEFEEMRKMIKAPMTDEAKKRLLSKLEKLAGNDTKKKIEILQRSIDHDWKGVYPLERDTRSTKDSDTEELPEGWEKIFGS